MTLISPIIEADCVPLSQLQVRERAVVHMTELDTDEREALFQWDYDEEILLSCANGSFFQDTQSALLD